MSGIKKIIQATESNLEITATELCGRRQIDGLSGMFAATLNINLSINTNLYQAVIKQHFSSTSCNVSRKLT